MNIEIQKDAFKILLNVLLSCRCPISEDVEKRLIKYFKKHESLNAYNYNEIMNIANKGKGETVFHRLKEFCLYSVNDFSSELTISLEDVLRHFSSGFHWRLVEKGLSSGYKNLTFLPSWFIGHMLMPVKLEKENKKMIAKYAYSKSIIRFKNIFIPKEIKILSDKFYCIHFGFVISQISEEQSKMLFNELEIIDNFRIYRENLSEIDFSHYQRYGDYFNICKTRYSKYF